MVTPTVAGPLSTSDAPPLTLSARMRWVAERYGHSPATAAAFADWTSRLVTFHGQRHPRDLRHRLTGHVGAVHAVAVAPDGLLIASGGADGTIRLGV